RSQLRVGLGPDQRGQLRRVRHVQRLCADVRLRRRGAPPVQVVPALAPAAPVELGQRGDQYPGIVRPLRPLLVPADRQLPAHAGLVLRRVYAVAQRRGVQRAAATGREVRVVEENARAAVAGGGAAGGILPVDGVHLGVVLEAAPVVLPGLRVQLAGGVAD